MYNIKASSVSWETHTHYTYTLQITYICYMTHYIYTLLTCTLYKIYPYAKTYICSRSFTKYAKQNNKKIRQPIFYTYISEISLSYTTYNLYTFIDPIYLYVYIFVPKCCRCNFILFFYFILFFLFCFRESFIKLKIYFEDLNYNQYEEKASYEVKSKNQISFFFFSSNGIYRQQLPIKHIKINNGNGF